MRFPISFFGIRHAGAPEELVKKGRRRVVAYLAFIVFVLLVAAASDEEWVEGGYEVTFTATQNLGNSDFGCTGCDIPSSIVRKVQAPGALGVDIHREFLLGLDKITIESQFNMRYTNEAVQQDCVFPLAPWIREINAAAQANDTSPWNLWRGLQPIKPSTFSSTLGLVGFAAFLQVTVWLTMVLVQYQAPYVSESVRSLWYVRVVSIGATFFAIVALLVFGASSIKSEFCKAFDPDANFNGLPCGFGNGFNVAIAAVVFGALQSLAAWLWMPLEVPPTYAFSKGGNGASSAVGFTSTAYEPAGGSSGSTGISASAYNSESSSGYDGSSSSTSTGGYNAIGATTDL